MKKGLGANLLVGGKDSDNGKGTEWVAEFSNQMGKEDVKGKFIFVNETGIELMKLATSASDVWVSMPRATREASGTSDQRAALNGHYNIATATGGPLAYIKHGITGWLMDIFNIWNLQSENIFSRYDEAKFAQVVRRFNSQENGIIEEFRWHGRRQLGEYFIEAIDLYNNAKDRWMAGMKRSFVEAHREVSIDVMIQKYGLFFESALDGTCAKGYLQKYQASLANRATADRAAASTQLAAYGFLSTAVLIARLFAFVSLQSFKSAFIGSAITLEGRERTLTVRFAGDKVTMPMILVNNENIL